MSTTRYRLLEGEHIEPDDTEAGTKVRRGDVFDSVNDWYAERWPEKFRKVDDQPIRGFVFDPTKESLEEFTARVKSAQEEKAPAITATAAPGTEADTGLREVLESMTARELHQHAQEEGIDLKGVSRKEDVIRLIMASAAPV